MLASLVARPDRIGRDHTADRPGRQSRLSAGAGKNLRENPFELPRDAWSMTRGSSRRRLLDDPIADGLQSLGSDRRFDRGILARGAGLAGLQEVVQARELDRLDVAVPAGLEGLVDLREVLLGADLQVFGTVD